MRINLSLAFPSRSRIISFVSLLLPPTDRQSTPHIKKTLNPTFPPETSTFDFPLYLSMAGVIGGRGLEAVMWDKVSSETDIP